MLKLNKIKEAFEWANKFGYKELIKKPFYLLFAPIIIRFHPKHKFKVKNKDYDLFYHRYNFTWLKERGIEIPFFFAQVNSNRGRKLEVGNVLSHYFKPEWDIVDKYEKGRGVINEDINTFNPEKKYDLIFSISTFEHIGWDEYGEEQREKSSEKIQTSFKNLKDNCLKKSGKIIISVPIGWNPKMDEIIFSNKLLFKEIIFLKRVGKTNWLQVNKQEAKNSKYGKPFPHANCVAFGIYQE